MLRPFNGKTILFQQMVLWQLVIPHAKEWSWIPTLHHMLNLRQLERGLYGNSLLPVWFSFKCKTTLKSKFNKKKTLHIRQQYTLLEYLKWNNNKLTITSVVGDVEHLKLSCIAAGNWKLYIYFRKQFGGFCEVKYTLTIWLRNPTSGDLFKRNKNICP